ncbi:YoaK family protein [Pseudorhizobium pelagicum]|uniref:Membrane protein n=1 Tax=Pseudorhizobium pelagicum TaxID=1509405 RepID=A0A922TAZ6_9HYPH|nr:YoaK family protein [Pseudorhizobium pelagicum]KEQ04385.1 membrane protein [Pseudorhizobium pelagicum]KEQ07248.1 membrane protein [Pseudorhizobium pelagicum]
MTLARRRHLVRTRRTVTGLVLVAAISFVAGMTDAVGLLLSGDFVSFMTGNTTRAALFFAEGDYGHALILFLALWVFVIGNALGIILAYTLSSRRTFVVLTGVALTIALAALVPDEGYPRVQFYLIILAMGMINATVEHIEGLPIGLTYITGALSRFGRGIGRWFMGDRNPTGWVIQTVPWTGMACGAVTGAFLTNALGKDALWVVALSIVTVAIATVFLPRPLHLHFQQRIDTGAPRRR